MGSQIRLPRACRAPEHRRYSNSSSGTMHRSRHRLNQLESALHQEPPHHYSRQPAPTQPNLSVREFACEIALPAEAMLARQAMPPHGASLYQIRGNLRMCFVTGRFELAVSEKARAHGANFPATRSCSLTDHHRGDFAQSSVVTGAFEHVVADRYTFWCETSLSENGAPRYSCAQFDGVLAGGQIH